MSENYVINDFDQDNIKGRVIYISGDGVFRPANPDDFKSTLSISGATINVDEVGVSGGHILIDGQPIAVAIVSGGGGGEVGISGGFLDSIITTVNVNVESQDLPLDVNIVGGGGGGEVGVSGGFLDSINNTLNVAIVSGGGGGEVGISGGFLNSINNTVNVAIVSGASSKTTFGITGDNGVSVNVTNGGNLKVSIEEFDENALIPIPTTSFLTGIAASTSNQMFLNVNTDRIGMIIYNRSDSNLLIKFGSGAAINSFNILIEPSGAFEMQRRYWGGRVDGVWEGSPVGSGFITELI